MKKYPRGHEELELMLSTGKGKKIIGKDGNNSSIIKLKNPTDQREIAVKFYRKNNKEHINRQRRESNFIKKAKETKAKDYVPTIFMEKEDKWTAFYWIEGENMKTLKETDIMTIGDFIENLNQKKNNDVDEKENAVDALINISALEIQLNQRIKEIIEAPKVSGKEDLRDWMINKVIQKGIKDSNKIYDKIKCENYFTEIKNSQILSPSDVGIHNTIRTEKGLVFIDFEYSGFDDLAKLACDWVLQPEYPLNRKKEEQLINRLEEMDVYANKTKNWIQRYMTIKELYHFKWCLIMYKCMCITNKIKYDEEKIWKYFSICKN